MKVRIVAVALTVALGLWSGAYAQEPEEDFLEFRMPGQDLEPNLESELPSQGAFSDSPIPAIDAREASSRARATGPFDEWLSSVRGRASRAPRRRIALGVVAVCVFLMTAWAGVAFLRKRSRRAYRRLPRSAGGSPTRSLEEVVAAVQLGQSRSHDDRPLEEPVTGREWPR